MFYCYLERLPHRSSTFSSVFLPDSHRLCRVWTLPYGVCSKALNSAVQAYQTNLAVSPPLTGFQKIGLHEEVRGMTKDVPASLAFKGQRSAIGSGHSHTPSSHSQLLELLVFLAVEFPRMRFHLSQQLQNISNAKSQRHAMQRPG